jgi:hypothetical protein
MSSLRFGYLARSQIRKSSFSAFQTQHLRPALTQFSSGPPRPCGSRDVADIYRRRHRSAWPPRRTRAVKRPDSGWHTVAIRPNGPAIQPEMAGNRRYRPTLFPNCIRFHIILQRQQTMNLLITSGNTTPMTMSRTSTSSPATRRSTTANWAFLLSETEHFHLAPSAKATN